jgi:hypothetical protein
MPKGVYKRTTAKKRVISENQKVYHALLKRLDHGLTLIRESVSLGLLSEEHAKEILADTIKALTGSMNRRK